MRNALKTWGPIVLTCGLLLASCNKDENYATENSAITGVSAKASIKKLPANLDSSDRFQLDSSVRMVEDFDAKLRTSKAVAPSECEDTPFNAVADFYNDLLIDSFLATWDENPDAIGIILEDYFVINQIAAAEENKNTDYFGADGEYSNYVRNRTRSLEKFWDMPDLISVRGQHTETLEDLEFIRFIYENYSTATDDQIDYFLEIAESFNTASDQIPENPFFASDGFATFDRKIVIGDGIVTFLEDTGLDPKVVWSSILAHEWGHQIQFLNLDSWEYPLPPFANTPESTRMTELEADFFTGYYLTHKRGATYNWKRVEDFLTAFFNIGDCSFQNSGHHGTPLQRLAAARAGYDLANGGQKKGKILGQLAVHDEFVAQLDEILNSPVSVEAAR